MFTNTAYEALYEYIGLQLHSKFIEVITSHRVFGGLVLLIFGVSFFLTAAHFFSRYIPGALVKRKSVPLSHFVKIVFFLFLGVGLLRVGTFTDVKKYDGKTWGTNPYIIGKAPSLAPSYKVSLIFDLLSRSAEEVAALINRVIDSTFSNTNSQVEAPDFFYKAIMYAGAGTIDDPELKRAIGLYTEECFDRLLPLIGKAKGEGRLNGFFADSHVFDRKLGELVVDQPSMGPAYTCLDVKTDLRIQLKSYATKRPFGASLEQHLKNNSALNSTNFENLLMSGFLVNHFNSEHEAALGIQKGSQLPSTSARVFQYLNRLFSFEGVFSIFGFQGQSVAASRSQEFSENLARAPHVAGFIKLILIAAFPWLIFFVVAGKWKVLYYWFLIYFSVLLWAPIWTLLYHIMTGIAVSAETMSAFGALNDGISLYSSQLILSRVGHMYAVYSWLQILTGTLFTGMLLYFLRPALNDTQADQEPDFIDGASGVVKTVGKVL